MLQAMPQAMLALLLAAPAALTASAAPPAPAPRPWFDQRLPRAQRVAALEYSGTSGGNGGAVVLDITQGAVEDMARLLARIHQLAEELT